MFEVSLRDIDSILRDYNIQSKCTSFTELQRYHYEKGNPESKEVRLIIRVECESKESLVIRFKNESGVSLELIEMQSQFAELLKSNGISTPVQYKSKNFYARWYQMNGYNVIVTVEQFVKGEIKCVDVDIAGKTGKLLAKMHTIAEENQIHVQNHVLFDPFTENDLFSFSCFASLRENLSEKQKVLFDRIVDKYNEYMKILSPLRQEPRYAVQGDISDCNLYQTEDGDIGIFDFNRCGDNNLFCDAVMQAVFEARLMDYPADYGEDYENIILNSFLKGYESERPFTDKQKKYFLYLYAIIDAFWSTDIKYNDNSFEKACIRKDTGTIQKGLDEIWRRIRCLKVELT